VAEVKKKMGLGKKPRKGGERGAAKGNCRNSIECQEKWWKGGDFRKMKACYRELMREKKGGTPAPDQYGSLSKNVETLRHSITNSSAAGNDQN